MANWGAGFGAQQSPSGGSVQHKSESYEDTACCRTESSPEELRSGERAKTAGRVRSHELALSMMFRWHTTVVAYDDAESMAGPANRYLQQPPRALEIGGPCSSFCVRSSGMGGCNPVVMYTRCGGSRGWTWGDETVVSMAEPGPGDVGRYHSSECM